MSYNYPLLWLTNPSIFYAFPPLFPPFPNHYMTCHDLAPPTIVTDDLNIAYFRFQVRRTVSLGWRFNERRNVVTSKHWCEGWIVRPLHLLPLLSNVSQFNKSMQQYHLFDTYYASWIRVPIDLSKSLLLRFVLIIFLSKNH